MLRFKKNYFRLFNSYTACGGFKKLNGTENNTIKTCQLSNTMRCTLRNVQKNQSNTESIAKFLQSDTSK